MKTRQSVCDLKLGDFYKERGRKARVEGVAEMYALVYYGKGDFRVVRNRPFFYTSSDLIIKVRMVHRCGTEVKYYHKGHPLIDSLLLHRLRDMTGLKGNLDSSNLDKYVHLLEMGERSLGVKDQFYGHLYENISSQSSSQNKLFRQNILREWGRIVGHELVGEIEKVGSNVRNLTKPLGYFSTFLKKIPANYINFEQGERVILQSRCARHKKVPAYLQGKKVAGVQILGSEIEDLSRTLDGGFAQFIRVTPELIQSGCVIRVSDDVSDVDAALIEPTACLIDCLGLGTRPEGLDETGYVMKKGVARGGTTLIIGSGGVAFIAAELALTYNEAIQVGGASKVVMLVRSNEKAELGRRLFQSKFDGRIDFSIYNSDLPHKKIVSNLREKYGKDRFNDVIVAAGDARTIELAHQIVSGTGWRVFNLAGTHGEIAIESGLWHYSNGCTLGTSGCNTKTMENALRMVQNGTIELAKFSGKQYTFKNLRDDASAFFKDKYLRPVVLPNMDVPKVEWQEL